jgi:hypothetical protein
MQLTERDISILKFINQFGFCEIQHIQRRFFLKIPRSYQIMQRLVKAGLIKHVRVFFSHPGFFLLSDKGAYYTELPALDHITLGNYLHYLTIIEVYLRLNQRYSNIEWISERELIHNKLIGEFSKRWHIADGILIFSDDRKIAIEVELNFKGMHRTEQILKEYSAQFSIHEVWYFCEEHVFWVLREMASEMPFIKVFSLKEFLHV